MSAGLFLLGQVAAAASVPLYPAEALPEPVLAEHRGGFRLPSGIEAALTVQTQTAVDGAIVLRTVLAIKDAVPDLKVFTPERGTSVRAQTGLARSGSAPGPAASVTYDRQSGIHIDYPVTPSINISASGPAADAAVPNGLEQVDVTAPVTTDQGIVTASLTEGLRSVSLNADGLQLTHFVGGAFGTAVANSGSDRTIDTVTSVSLDLGNAGPDVLGSSMLRVEALGIDALASRM